MCKEDNIDSWRKKAQENLLDIAYKDIPEYPKTKSYLERFSFYRQDKKHGIDIDVCREILCIHKTTNPLISTRTKIDITQQTLSNKYKYQIIADDLIFRGETLVNCLQFLIQIARICNNSKSYSSKDVEKIIRDILDSDIYNNDNKLQFLIEKFVYNCYTPGNFLAIPYVAGKSLNQAKGRLKELGYNYTISDSFYAYLNVLFDYFDKGIVSVQLTRYIDNVSAYNVWSKYRLEGKNKFINDNVLEDFTCDGKAIKFWCEKCENPVENIITFLEKINTVLENRTKKLLKYKNQ